MLGLAPIGLAAVSSLTHLSGHPCSGLLECPCTDRITKSFDASKPFGECAGQKITYTHGSETGNQTGVSPPLSARTCAWPLLADYG